jgi:hypothetical protein
MRSVLGVTFGVFLAMCVVPSADAQDNSPRLDHPTPNAASPPATLTGKERLGRKWMDEQRIDNCNVPVDKRGSRPRLTACTHLPMG